MSELLSWIGLIIGFAALITVIAAGMLWISEKLGRKPSAQDPQTTTKKKPNYQYKTKLERYEEVLRNIASDLVTSGATAGSTQLIQAVDDYSKAAKKAINRSMLWTGVATTLVLQGYMLAKQNGSLPAPLKPDPTVRQHVQPDPASIQRKPANNPAPNPQTSSDAPVINAAESQKQPEYSPEFEREWGGLKGELDFAKSYEENYKKETGIGFNDSQKTYVRDVIVKDFKARVYKIFQSLGDSVSGDQVDAALDAASADVMKEVGPIHQARLLAMMDGEQVAKLSSFLSGINTASPHAQSKSKFSPAFEYLWSGGHGDEYVVTTTQKNLESMSGIAFNDSQKEYVRRTFVPEWKSEAADAFGKLDLSSGKVTGSNIGSAIGDSYVGCLNKHSDRLYAMMDSDQLRIIKNRAATKTEQRK